MPEIERFDILVIGSGEPGKHLTRTMAQAGHRTAVVERKYIGGSCPNIACLPSKNVIRSAKANWFARTALRTVETSSYTYFGALRRSPSLSKLFSVLVSWPLTR